MKNLDLYKNNYEKVWEEIQKYLKKWDNLKLSSLGRIATIKMNFLDLCSYFKPFQLFKKM